MEDPPRMSRLLVGLIAGGAFRQRIRTDLQEEFDELVLAKGSRAARRWYRLQVLRSLGPLLWWRISRRGAGWRRVLRGLVASGPGRDVGYAFRSLRAAPGFSAVVILTFALGIGVNTAVFSLIHSLVLEPLPVPGGDRMVQLWRFQESRGEQGLFPPAPPMVGAWQRSGLFDDIGGYAEEELHLSLDDGTVAVSGARVSPEVLGLISATPLVGRLFGPEDARRGGGRVAALSESVWVRVFGADPSVVGRTVVLDGEARQVVGVFADETRALLERGFFGARPKEILVPLTEDAQGGWEHDPYVVARLVRGLSPAVAQERLDGIQERVAPLMDGHSEWFPLLRTGSDSLPRSFRRGLWIVLGAVGLVLAIACANVATLLLVRRLSRVREMSIRLALGAGRARLTGQLLTESLILGAAGIVLAMLVAGHMVDAAVWMAGEALPEIQAARLDREALGFAVAAGLATTVAFGLVPALHVVRVDSLQALGRQPKRARRMPAGWAAHRSLVVAQVALAVVLVVGAGLFSRSLGRLLSVDPGFDMEGLAAVALELPRARYEDGAERIALFDEVVRRLEGHRAVEAVGWARFVPPRVAGAIGAINVEGRPPTESEPPEPQAGNWVTPGYFEAVGAPFVEGRPFTPAEIADGAEVVVLNRSAAQRYWPGGGAVGSRIRLVSDFGPTPWMTVVGVVPDVKAWWLGDLPDRVQIYLPVSNMPPRSAVFLVRGRGALGGLASLVQSRIRSLDPSLPIGEAYWVSDAFRQSVARQRFQAVLLSSFGLVGILLAVLGVYGALSLSVTRRTREIGVRLALGATPWGINRRVLGQGLRAVLLGAAIGTGLAYLTSGILADQLWGIEATDPSTYAFCLGGVLVAGLGAAWVSARRALRIDPVQAMSRE